MSLLGAFSRRGRNSEAPTWGEITARLARAVLTLLRAEASSLSADLVYGVAVVRSVAIWFALTLCFGICAVLALSAAAVLGLSSILPAWAASLVVGLALMVIGACCAVALRRRADQLESPTRTVSRRLTDHADWWQHELTSLAHPERSAREAEDPAGERKKGVKP